jgi:ubiquinone/menaquinone biosynthesis C-methylase UbiE
MIEVPPYKKLAIIYDQLMDHVDYEQWSVYILDLLHRLKFNVHSIIDLSCGTANLVTHLEGIVTTIYGCDQSISMIDQAKQKHTNVPVFVNDIRTIALKNDMVDCALFLYDSLNYITEIENLETALREVHRILFKGGIFIFDIVSESHCKEYYADYHESEYWNDMGYSRHSYYSQEKGMQYNEFRIVINGRTYVEKHSQRIFSLEFLNDILSEHSFEIVNIFDEFSFEKANKESGRLHFVCKTK